MLISVVIPAHNRPQLLVETVQSVAQQKYGEFEVVVVDDGSQPPIARTGLEAILGPGLAFLRHEHAQGISRSKNAGVRLARGAVILILDDDDLLTPDSLQFIAEAFARYPELDCLFMGVEPFGQFASGPARNRQMTIQKLIERAKPEDRDGLLFFSHNLFEALIGRVPIDFQRPAARRGAWDRVGGFDEDALFAESSCAVVASLDCNVALTKKPLTRWRIHGNNFGWPPNMTEREIAARNIANAMLAAQGLRKAIDQRERNTNKEKRIVSEYFASLCMAHAFQLREKSLWAGVPYVCASVRAMPSFSRIRTACLYVFPQALIAWVKKTNRGQARG